MESFRRTFVPILVLLVVVFSIGTLGYYLIERWSLLDSLYMTVITLTTVGFGEIQPLSSGGRVFTIVLIFLGVGAVAFGAGRTGEYLLTTDIGRKLRRRQNKLMIEKMHGHVIVCGYGQVGSSATASLIATEREVVVVEIDEEIVDDLREKGQHAILGDATKDEILHLAGIERAYGLMVCGGYEADNLYIVLSARTLNPALVIVARSIDPDGEGKMLRAGADRVVSPYQLGGRFMANVLTRPGVTDFFRLVTLDSGLELWLEELVIEKDSQLAGHTVVEADLRRNTGATLVGLLRQSSGETLKPDETTRLESEDVLIVLGTRDQLAHVQELANSSAAEHAKNGLNT
jgi:voltage-gated potassium channel